MPLPEAKRAVALRTLAELSKLPLREQIGLLLQRAEAAGICRFVAVEGVGLRLPAGRPGAEYHLELPGGVPVVLLRDEVRSALFLAFCERGMPELAVYRRGLLPELDTPE